MFLDILRFLASNVLLKNVHKHDCKYWVYISLQKQTPYFLRGGAPRNEASAFGG